MSFSNQQSRVKNQIVEPGKLGLYSQVRNIAENGFVTVDRSAVRRRRWRNWDRRGRNWSVRHFGDADVASETRHVQPIHNGKIRQRHQKHADDHQSPGNNLDESERHRHQRRGSAESYQVSESCPCAYGKYWSGSFSKKSNGGGERPQRVLTVADREHAGEREQPVQGRPCYADQSSQRKEKNENQRRPWV